MGFDAGFFGDFSTVIVAFDDVVAGQFVVEVDCALLTGSDDGRHSNTSLAWGPGVQINPTESVAVDVAYEGSGSGDWRTDGFIVGVGYKF